MNSKILTIAAFALVVFADIGLELGVAAGALYVLVLVLARASDDEQFVVAAAAAAVVMVIGGYLLSPVGGEPWQVLFNRALSLVLIVCTSSFLWHEMKMRRIVEEQSAGARHLASIVEFSEEAIISGTLEGDVITWNEGAEVLFGYSAEEMVGHNVRALIPRHLQSEYRLAQDRLEKGKALVGMETTRIRKDGSLIEVSVTTSPILEADGNVKLLSSIVRDLSSQRQAERERNHLAALVNSSQEAIVSTDFHGTILSWNAGAEQLYGIPVDQAIGLSIEKTVPDGERGELREMFKTLQRGERVEPFLATRVTEGGGEVEVECHAHPIRDQHGHTRSVAIVARDITQAETERRRLEEAGAALEARLKARTAEMVELQRQLRKETDKLAQTEARLESSKRRLAQRERGLAAFRRRTAQAFKSSVDSVGHLSEQLLNGHQGNEPALALAMSLRRRAARMRTLLDELWQDDDQGRDEESSSKTA